MPSEWGTAKASGTGSRVIGAHLKNMTSEIVALGEQFQALQDSSLAARIAEALSVVKQRHCRIAILGQIKAGKSSFVNALAGHPGLLPTDVNPWTAVVTKLHFGMPGQPEHGARFTFFEKEEWHQFAQNTGELKQLTDRLVPGYEEDQYQQSIAAMRRRAELRLGQYYHHLFGKTRWYPEATPEVIERYVCLGQHVEESQSELAPGRYADITKTADIFFGADPFVSPVTVVDTPGTNDPFLIRNQITLRNIEDADVYVVVLTAQQPLTTSDLALLRILHGVRKSRIVVFVNRIDDISGIASGSEAILAGVQAVIRREFPAAHIPIVAGSALWANCALGITQGTGAESGAAPEHIWGPELIDYARHTGVMGKDEPCALTGPQAMPRERLGEVLFACSGMPAMISHISALMLRGMNGYWLSELASTLLAAADGMASSARNEIAALDSAMNKTGEDVTLAADLANIAAHLQQLRIVAGRIERHQAGAEGYLRKEMTASLKTLRQQLDDQVVAFADEQAQAVQQALLQRHGTRTWRCDTVPLRNAMEELVLHTFWEMGKLLIDTERGVTPELKRMLKEALPDINPRLTPTSLLNFNLTPSLTPLSKAVVFDLEDKWWQLWWRRAQSAEENAHKVQELVIAEFSPVAADLAHLVETDLENYVSVAIKRFFTRGLDIIRAVIEQEENLIGTYESLAAAGKSSPPVPMEQQNRIAELRHRLAAGEELAGKLKACIDRYAPLIHDEQRAPA